MRGFLFWLAAFLLAPAIAVAQQAGIPEFPQLSVVVTPREAVVDRGYAQGQLVLNIRLISRYPFEELNLAPPAIEGARTVQLLRPRTRRISGYAGQGYLFETALAVIPRRAGLLRIPAVRAVGLVEPREDEERPFDLAGDPIEIEISGIPDAYDADWWMVSPRVEIDETWSVPVPEIRVGETVRRRVSLRVRGVSAERLPTLVHPATQGVDIGLAAVETRTETSPDGMIAHADYVWELTVQQQQIVFLRPIGVDYWDPLEHRQKAVGLRGHRLEPLPVDSEATAAALMRQAEETRARTNILARGAALVLAAPCIVVLIALAWACLPSRSDRRLRIACGRDDPPETLYRAVKRWVAESGLEADETAQRIPACGALSDTLFAPDHPPESDRRVLLGQAMHWSRKARLSAIVDHVWRMAKGHRAV